MKYMILRRPYFKIPPKNTLTFNWPLGEGVHLTIPAHLKKTTKPNPGAVTAKFSSVHNRNQLGVSTLKSEVLFIGL